MSDSTDPRIFIRDVTEVRADGTTEVHDVVTARFAERGEPDPAPGLRTPDEGAASGESGGVPSAPAPSGVYDPAALLTDVQLLLAERGHSPAISTRDLAEALVAAERLLRCMGVTPVRRPRHRRLTALSDPANVDLREVPEDEAGRSPCE